jgi:hypothetical protein
MFDLPLTIAHDFVARLPLYVAAYLVIPDLLLSVPFWECLPCETNTASILLQAWII